MWSSSLNWHIFLPLPFLSRQKLRKMAIMARFPNFVSLKRRIKTTFSTSTSAQFVPFAARPWGEAKPHDAQVRKVSGERKWLLLQIVTTRTFAASSIFFVLHFKKKEKKLKWQFHWGQSYIFQSDLYFPFSLFSILRAKEQREWREWSQKPQKRRDWRALGNNINSLFQSETSFLWSSPPSHHWNRSLLALASNPAIPLFPFYLRFHSFEARKAL